MLLRGSRIAFVCLGLFLSEPSQLHACTTDLAAFADRMRFVQDLIHTSPDYAVFGMRYQAGVSAILPRELDRVKGIEVAIPGFAQEGRRLELNSAYVREASIHPLYEDEILGAPIDKKTYAAMMFLAGKYLEMYGGHPGTRLFLQGLEAVDLCVLFNSAFVTITAGPTSATDSVVAPEQILGFARLVKIFPGMFKQFKAFHPHPILKGVSLKERLIEAFGVDGKVSESVDSHLPLELRSGIELPRGPKEVLCEIGRMFLKSGFSHLLGARLYRELFLLAYFPWDGKLATTFYIEADELHVRLFRKFGFKVVEEVKLEPAVGETFRLMIGDRTNLIKAIQMKEAEFERIFQEVFGSLPAYVP